MRILLVTAMFPPTLTGTSFYSRNLAMALLNRNHAVRVVTLSTGTGDSESDAASTDFPVERLSALRIPLPGVLKHFRICSLIPANYARIRCAAQRLGAEVVLLVNHYLDIAFPAIFAAKACGIPLACSVGTQLQSLRPWRAAVLGAMDRVICGKVVFPFCDLVIAWDTEIMRYLQDVHGDAVTRKAVLVNYGVNGDIERFLRHKQEYGLRNQVLGVGAVSEQRSFVPLVGAFAILAAEFPELKLKIVGHVYYDAAVRLAKALGVAARVEFAGERSHSEVLASMAASDVMFSSLTGKYLGLGTATIESMLLGVPTLVNAPLDLLGHATLRDMEHIVHCPQLDSQFIAARLRRLLVDPALRARVGQGGRSFVLEHMNWQKVASQMEQALGMAARGMRA